MSAQQQVRLAQLLTSLPTRVATPVARMMADRDGLRYYARNIDYGGPKSLGDLNGFGPEKLLARIPKDVKKLEPEWTQVHTKARTQLAKWVRQQRNMARAKEWNNFNFPDPNPPGSGWR